MASKKLMTVAVVAVALVGGYSATAWFLGKQIEAVHAEMDAQLATVPYIKRVESKYERSLFSAVETSIIEFPSALFGSAFQTEGETTPPPPLRIIAKSHIQHGPLIDFSVFAAGRAYSTIEFEGELQQSAQAIFGDKPALSLLTTFDFQGGGNQTLSSPAFKINQAPNENQPTTISSDGIEAFMTFTKGLEKYTFKANMPRFEIATQDDGGMRITGLRMEGEQQRMFPDEPMMYSGSQQISLDEVAVDPGKNAEPDGVRKVNLRELKFDFQVPYSGDFVDIIAKMGAGICRIDEQDYGPVNYNLSFKHLHARKLTALNKQFMAIYANEDAPQTPGEMARAFAPMKETLVELLLDEPQFFLDQISFKTPEGEARLVASIRLDDAKAEDFDSPALLQSKIDLAADIALPVSLLVALPGSEPIVGALAQQNFVSVDNGLLKSKIAFKAGELMLNEKPFNPMMLMMQQGPDEEEESEDDDE